MHLMQLIKQQVLGTSTPKKLIYTKKCCSMMTGLFLTEAAVADCFYNGKAINKNMVIRRFNGYEIGLYYFQDKKSANYIITAVWKRVR